MMPDDDGRASRRRAPPPPPPPPPPVVFTAAAGAAYVPGGSTQPNGMPLPPTVARYLVPGAPVPTVGTVSGAPVMTPMTRYVVPGAPSVSTASGNAYGIGASGGTTTTTTTAAWVSGAPPNGSGSVSTRGRVGKRPRSGGAEGVDDDDDDDARGGVGGGGGGGRGRPGRGSKETRGADDKADGKSGGVNVTTTGKRRSKTTTLPTADEMPTLTPVDVSSLPEDVRRYREERAKHWPSDKNVKAKREAESTEEAQRAKEIRRERLKEILAKQREMGHFEASQEIGNDGEGVADSCAGAEAKEVVGADETKTKTKTDATKVCRFWLQGGCRKGDACDFKHESAPNSGQKCRFFARGRCKAGARCPFRHEAVDAGGKTVADAAGNPGNPQTLLKKLLNKEIKRDESRLLQLFRFFVNNDFLTGAKGRDEPFWMFPWVDDAVVDKRAATLATLPPVEDDPEDEDPASERVVPPSEEKQAPSANPRPDMGFFSAYDSEDEGEDEEDN